MTLQGYLVAACLAFASFVAIAQEKPVIVNPAIDKVGYARAMQDAFKHREQRRVSEEDFIKMSREPGTVVLDARSKEKFDELHVKGAINLSFPDIAIDSLKQTLPDKSARILIYCNNNFQNAPKAFPAKKLSAALNLSTYIALYNYGYENVYELGPLLDIKTTKIEFVSSKDTR